MEVFVWGENESGALGIGTLEDQRRPVAVQSQTGSEQIRVKHAAAGARHLVLVTCQDEVFVAGCNDEKQLCICDESDRLDVPVFVEELSFQKIKCLAGGRAHTLALRDNEEAPVIAFGSNNCGQLGVVEPRLQGSFCVPSPFGRVKMVSAGGDFSVALTQDGRVFSWGCNSRGQLGLGHQSDSSSPSLIDCITDASFISCGEEFCGVLANSSCLLFGDNKYGQLAQPKHVALSTSPISLNFQSQVVSLATGRRHSIIRASEGQLGFFGFGKSTEGQFGMDASQDFYSLVKLEHIPATSVTQVFLGDDSTFVWVSSVSTHPFSTKGLYGAGRNSHGQLGIGDTGSQQNVSTFTRVSEIPSTIKGSLACSSFAVFYSTDEADEVNTQLAPEAPQLSSRPQSVPEISLQMKKKADPGLVSRDLNTLRISGLLCDVGFVSAHRKESSNKVLGTRQAESTLPSPSEAETTCAVGKVLNAAEKNLVVVPVHSCLIKHRCPSAWQLIFESRRQVQETYGVPVVKLPTETQTCLERFVDFLYTGSEHVVMGICEKDLVCLAAVAIEFNLDRLVQLCESHVKKHLNYVNVLTFLIHAFEHQVGVLETLCLAFIGQHYEKSIASRNKAVVEELRDFPTLLAQVVGLSSSNAAKKYIQAAQEKEPYNVQPSSFLQDMERMFEKGVMADVEFFPFAQTSNKPSGVRCHLFVLVSRLETLKDALCGDSNSLTSPVQAGNLALRLPPGKRSAAFMNVKVKQSDRKEVLQLVDGSESSLDALAFFIKSLYTGSTMVPGSIALDVLMLCFCYSIMESELAAQCVDTLQVSLAPQNVVESLCVAHMVGQKELKDSALRYAKKHADKIDAALIHDALEDFPELGPEILL